MAEDLGEVLVPPCIEERRFDGNLVRCVLVPRQEVRLFRDGDAHWVQLQSGTHIPVIRQRPIAADGPLSLFCRIGRDAAIGPDSFSNVSWHGARNTPDPSDVLASMKGQFSFRQQDPVLGTAGLRAAQIGAVHAVLGYWTTGQTQAATVVMPTGSGKTETMLALLAAAGIPRLLVMVPSDALRAQLGQKFENLGLLHELGVVAPDVLRPVVGTINRALKTIEAAREVARSCNVVVATAAILDKMAPDVRSAFVSEFSHLFIDEAHHVAARTWMQVRDEFEKRPVIQFTATPFREDGKRLLGREIYTYPLGEARRQGIYSRITYRPIDDSGNRDEAVASAAIAQLRRDRTAGYDHLLMARVRRQNRVAEVLQIYERLAPEFHPVALHTGMTKPDRRKALNAIRADPRKSRVIVCVDMLGEGFDLPELKVAAMHDPHKSLAVTLQFIGRFARTANLGDATLVVARPEGLGDPLLRRLYAENGEWDQLITSVAEDRVAEEEERSEFERGFSSPSDTILVQNLQPKMSTVVYRSLVNDWIPDGALDAFDERAFVTEGVSVNLEHSVCWFVIENQAQSRWSDHPAMQSTTYDLYVLYWDSQSRLLYINSSNTASPHERLAKAVVGPTAALLRGPTVYRAMHGIERLVPTNVGVLDVRDRNRRFSLFAGGNVTEGFPDTDAQTKTQTNIFGYGFDEGARVSIGASLKGRIWSYREAQSLLDWVEWCRGVGTKLIDETINVDEVIGQFILPVEVQERPELVPLAVEWPSGLVFSTSEEHRVSLNDSSWPLFDTEWVLNEQRASGPIHAEVTTPDWRAGYLVHFSEEGMTFEAIGPEVTIKNRTKEAPLVDVLNQLGLRILFETDAILEPPRYLLRPRRELGLYAAEKLQAIEWNGVNLSVESRGPERRTDSIQARVLERLIDSETWDVVIDDDGTGEVADVVALRRDGRDLVVRLVHCKYAHAGQPAARVDDLYEVCGQVEKSARWRSNPTAMIERLRARERQRAKRGAPTGFVLGDMASLSAIGENVRLMSPRFEVVIAQPGVSVKRATDAQLSLLAASEVYVFEVARATLEVWCSE